MTKGKATKSHKHHNVKAVVQSDGSTVSCCGSCGKVLVVHPAQVTVR